MERVRNAIFGASLIGAWSDVIWAWSFVGVVISCGNCAEKSFMNISSK